MMVVNSKEKIYGSISGGIMEHKFVELAKEKLQQTTSELSIRIQYHDKTAARNQSGMICSGDQTILMSCYQDQVKISFGKRFGNSISNTLTSASDQCVRI